MRNNPPEKIIMVGPCRVSIFRNLVLKNGAPLALPKVVLEIRYKDAHGRWRSTAAITQRELPSAILALQQAYAYLANTAGRRPPSREPR